MGCGVKKVEVRPNYPSLRDLVPGTAVEFANRFSGRSFLATITSRRVHRDFATMLRKESIKDCLPDRDPYDLQRAVNVYHSFRHETYNFIGHKHGVVSLRFEHVEPVNLNIPHHIYTIGVITIEIPCVPYSNMWRENVEKGNMV